MRVAALYDIHGNFTALQAVLQEVSQEQVDRIVIGGDVLPGPMARETLARLAELKSTQFIYGNGEVAVLEVMAGREPSAVPPQYRPTIRWTAEQLDAESERWLRTWPKTARLPIPGIGDVLFCHATPRNENEIFTRLTPEDRLLPIFENVNAAVVVCGHTHMQFDRTIGNTRVVNAGSVGMPFGEAGADWLLLGPDIQLRHTRYELTEAAERIRSTKYPDADSFVEQYLLHPPSEEKMVDLFTRSGL